MADARDILGLGGPAEGGAAPPAPGPLPGIDAREWLVCETALAQLSEDFRAGFRAPGSRAAR